MTAHVSSMPVSTKKKVGIKDFVGTFGASILVEGCIVIQGPFLARLLDPVGRGDYAAIILWPMILANIGLFGVNFSVGRVAAKQTDAGPILRSGLVLALLSSCVTVLIGYWLLPLLIPVEKHYILPLAKLSLLYVPVYQLASSLAAVDQGSGNFFRLNVIRACQSPVFIICLIVIYLLEFKSLFWFAAAWLLSFTAVSTARMILLVREYPLVGPLYSPFKVVRESFSFGIVGIGDQIYHYIDRILLLWLLEPIAMGLYVIALSASSLVNIIASSVGLVSFTVTAQATEREGFLRVASIFRKAVVVKLVGGIALALVMPVALPLVYGKDFAEAVTPAIILTAGTFFSGLSLLLDQCLRGQGKPYAGMLGRIGAIIAVIIVGFSSTKVWGLGIGGMAIAFLTGQLIYLFTIMIQTVAHYKDASLRQFVPQISDLVVLLAIGKLVSAKISPRKWMFCNAENNDYGQ